MLEPCVVAGLDWAEPMMYFFVARHMIMHYSCVHIFSFPPWYILLIDAFLFLSLSLSLSQIVCAWHPSIKLLRPRTFSIPGHLLLIPHFSMSGFVIRRFVRTFQRTSPNMAFIRIAMLSYRTTLILLFLLSYVGRVGNLFVRYLWIIPSWSYKSFTPICTVLIIPYLVSLFLFEVLI